MDQPQDAFFDALPGAQPEETLDPQDWEAMRQLGHRMVDEMLEYLQTLRERAPWQPVPEDTQARLRQPLPQQPQNAEAVYADFLRDIRPYPMGNIHPRFWAMVVGTGTPLGMLAEMLAAGMNPNLGAGDHGANYVEQQVIDWAKEMMGFPPESSGLLVSGGSMANLVGLAVARTAKAGFDVRHDGLQGVAQPLTVYGSREMHSSVQKAVELLGIGSAHLRMIPVNAEYQIDLAALRQAIAADRAAGLQPFAVVGNAATVNTGAIDDLDALADLCAEQDLWFHVDGAFGALAALAPRLKPALNGMQRADSLAFDLHKWLYMPIEVGCALIRNPELHRATFSVTPQYLAHGTRGMLAGDVWFSELGLQLSRGFRALKVWMSLKEHGAEKYGRLIQQNVDQACYLAARIQAEPELELLAPVPLNVVCFRYAAPGMGEEQLDRLNRELLVRLHESGAAVPSFTRLGGRYAIRVANTNHRSRREDFDLLVRESVRLGREIAQVG